MKRRRSTDHFSSTSPDGVHVNHIGIKDRGNEVGDNSVGLGCIRMLVLPSKSWAPHEFSNFIGVSLCSLQTELPHK